MSAGSRRREPHWTPGRRVVLAHRGASAEAPENTLPAFALAELQGADALEIDVRLTADGVVVVHHDDTTDRLTNGRAPVRALTLEGLRRFDAGYRFTMDGGRTFPYRGRGIAVPTLAEVLSAHPTLGINVDLKDHDPEMARAVVETVHRAGAADRTLLTSFDAAVLAEVRRLDGGIATGLAQVEVRAFYVAYWAGRCVPGRTPRDTGERLRKTGRIPDSSAALQVPPRHRGLALVTPGAVAAAHAARLAVHVWTVDDPIEMRRLLAAGADGIVTNRPGLAREVVDRFLPADG
ncbi:MAG TPA: glycerophosphodiester phosphodiesterase [Thermodesulfobacteriota bacterium]